MYYYFNSAKDRYSAIVKNHGETYGRIILQGWSESEYLNTNPEIAVPNICTNSYSRTIVRNAHLCTKIVALGLIMIDLLVGMNTGAIIFFSYDIRSLWQENRARVNIRKSGNNFR